MEKWKIGVSILFGWVFLMVFVAWMSTKYRKLSITDFATTGGSLGLLTLFLTYSATYHSSYAFMGTTGAVFAHGMGWWNNIHWTVIPGILLWLVGKRVWAVGRKYNYLSIGAYTQGTYSSSGSGKILSYIVSAVAILFVIPYTAIQALGVSYLFQIVSQGKISFTAGLVIFLVLMVFITWLGGMRGVAWTDTIQGIFMFLAMWIGGYLVITNSMGGIVETFREGVAEIPEAFSLPGMKGAYTGRFWVSQWITITFGMIAMPHVFLRYFAGRSLKIIKWSGVFSSIYLTFLYVFVPGVGVAAKLLYPASTTADKLFPEMLLQYVPFGIAAFAIAGALAAALSTADSQLHAASTVFTVDIYKPLIKPGASEEALYRVDRIFVFVFGAVCAWIAFNKPGLFLNILQISTSGTAVLAPVLFLPLFWDRVTSGAALAATLAGETAVIITTFFWKDPLGLIAGFWGILTSLVLLIILSMIGNKREKTVVETINYLREVFSD
jgi:SSS family solute:Na+ symporter